MEWKSLNRQVPSAMTLVIPPLPHGHYYLSSLLRNNQEVPSKWRGCYRKLTDKRLKIIISGNRYNILRTFTDLIFMIHISAVL